MWNYKTQIRIRWISFVIGLILLGLMIFLVSQNGGTSKTQFKICLTQYQVEFENLPIWVYPVEFIVTVGLMLLGVPSICFVIPLLLLKNTTFAFIYAAACQITASFIAMYNSYKADPLIVSDFMSKKLKDNEENFQSFAFWSRLYYNIPLRTVDRITPLVHNSELGLYNSLIAASCGILIRICIPTLLTKYIINYFTLLEPNPASETNNLLIWASVLIVYTILPKMPELMICPDKVKKVIVEFESPSVPKISGKEQLREEMEKQQSELQKEQANSPKK